MFKKVFLIFLIIFSVVSFADDNVQPVFTDNKNPIKVSQGQTFAITLQSNATTGYSWKWDATTFDQNLVTLVSHKYIAPQNKKMVGAPGYEVWTFKAKPADYRVMQMGHIVMEYQRPWEKTPGTTKTFVVHVK